MVGGLQQHPAGLAVGDDVLVELELSAGAKDAAQIGERAVLVGDRAEHEAGDGGVDALAASGSRLATPASTRIGTAAVVAASAAAARRVGSGSIAITSATVVG